MGSAEHTIAIVGAGAAGLACAVTVAQGLAGTPTAHTYRIVVLECGSKPGRSILASGNGRCNFSNQRLAVSVDRSMYHNAEFVNQAACALSASPAAGTLPFLRSLGLLWRQERDGMLFPYSNKAQSVLDVLLLAAKRSCVQILCEHEVASVAEVRHDAGGFVLQGRRGVETSRTVTAKGRVKRALSWEPFDLFADVVVIATGNGVTPEIVPGIALEPQRWVLGPICTECEPIHGLDGVRAQVRASLAGIHTETGEVLFRSYGVSGIVSFNLSRYCQRGDVLELDFVPDYERDAFAEVLCYQLATSGATTLDDALSGVFAPALRQALFKRIGAHPNDAITRESLVNVICCAKAFPLKVLGVADDQSCQVQRGGVAVNQVDAATCALRSYPSCYVLGEALDVDGPCGGYNLDWAWTSALLAGQAIVAKLVH